MRTVDKRLFCLLGLPEKFIELIKKQREVRAVFAVCLKNDLLFLVFYQPGKFPQLIDLAWGQVAPFTGFELSKPQVGYTHSFDL